MNFIPCPAEPGTRISGSKGSIKSRAVGSGEEQPDEVADLRPLGERSRHAARYYPTGEKDGLGQRGGPAEETRSKGMRIRISDPQARTSTQRNLS